MENASFENITVQDIMKLASVRPGSFYARFPDKLSLLGVLFDRYSSDVETIVQQQLPKLEHLTAVKKIRAIICLVGITYRTRRGVARSAALHYWNCAVQPPFLKKLERRQAKLIKQVSAFFLAAVSELTVQPAKADSAFALRQILISSREHYLFGHKAKSILISDGEFETKLAKMVLGFLQTKGAEQ